MIKELFELHKIKRIISVDDCYSVIDEIEIKNVLYSEMTLSFVNFKEALIGMGYESVIEEFYQMQDIGDDVTEILSDLLDKLSKEQLLSLYDQSHSKEKYGLMDEREKLIGFLDKLKKDGVIDEYMTCGSTVDALDEKYIKGIESSDGVLWLIDKNFNRVGESEEAGIELAKSIVERNKGSKNYVYILSGMGKDYNEDDGLIEKKFDALIRSECEEQVASLIYYLYKQRISSNNPEKLAKSLAYGFKRKACYELFGEYRKCLSMSFEESEKELYDIRQDILNYLLDEQINEYGESHLDFLTRFVNIIQTDTYQKALADNYDLLAQKMLYYKQLCQIATEKASNIPETNKKIKKFREKELYNHYINKQHLEISTGDIFKLENKYYILVSQACDIALRAEGERILNSACLLEICDNSNFLPYKYELQCFGTFSKPILNYHLSPVNISFEILDLCVLNENGEASISTDILSGLRNFELDYYSEAYKARMLKVVPKLESLRVANNHMSQLFAGDSNVTGEVAQIAFETIKFSDPELLKFAIKDGMLNYDVQRVCRIDELFSTDIVNQYGNYLSRIGHAFDFMNKPKQQRHRR